MQLDQELVLAIDIGGTKISAGLVDPDGRIANRQEVLTVAQEGRDAVLQRVEALGRAVLAAAPGGAVRTVGVASAGQIDSTGRVYYATGNLPGWNGLELTSAIEAMFGLPAAADNDVNAMAVAEQMRGAGRGYRDVLCVMVGTGIGGALVQNGVLYHGAFGGAGELGHTSIQAMGGRLCNCGGQGCLEVYASSRAVIQDTIHAIGEKEVSQWFGKPADALSIQDIAAAFHRSDQPGGPELQHVVALAADYLGAGLAAAANLMDPELIVIAGSILLFGSRYLEMVQESFHRRAMVPRRAARICFSGLGADPTLLGAALIARQRFDQPGQPG